MVVASVMACLAVAALAGCSDSTGGGSADGGSTTDTLGLIGALGRVRATDSTRAFVQYGNVAKTGELVEADRPRFLTVRGHGLGRIKSHSESIASELGFDPLSFREAVHAGKPGDGSAILWGDYNVEEVDKRFASRGIQRAERGGATEWTIGADGALAGIVPLNEFDNVRTQPGSFAHAPKRDNLAWVTAPGDDTLARHPAISAVAGCLGDVVAATIATEGFDVPVAVGVRAPTAADISEVICVAAGSADRAVEIRDHVTELIKSGAQSARHTPWSVLLPNATTEVSGESVVRVVSTPEPPDGPGRLLGLVETFELKELVETR